MQEIIKVNNRTTCLGRIPSYLNREVLGTSARALIQCYCVYGCVLGIKNTSKPLKSRLQTSQNQLDWCIAFYPRTRLTPANFSRWLSVGERGYYLKMCHVFKISNNMACSYLYFSKLDDVHGYSTNVHLLIVSCVKAIAWERFSFCSARVQWNTLPLT